MQLRSFFRWMPTAIVLWVFGGLSAFLTVLNIWFVIQAAQNSSNLTEAAGLIEGVQSRHLVQFFLGGVIANTMISVLCIYAWHLMRKRTQNALLLGAFMIMICLFITMLRWLYEWMKLGITPGCWIEPVFIWLPLTYAIIYAYKVSRTPPANTD